MIRRFLITLTALAVVCRAQLPVDGSECDIETDKNQADPSDCTVYYTCTKKEGTDDGIWIKAKCVYGFVYNSDYNNGKGGCQMATKEEECEGYLLPPPSDRSIEPGCEDKFLCPVDLPFFVYPDWQDCTQFYTCERGTIRRIPCSNYNGLVYFSASVFSCVPGNVNVAATCLNGNPARP